MSTENKNPKPTKFKITRAPYAEFSKLIEQGIGKRIDPDKLADEIRKHGVKAMPTDIEDFLCQFLSGEIETRGRRGTTPLERILYGRHLNLLYRHIHAAVTGAEDAHPDAIQLYSKHAAKLGDSYSPSEMAWRLVSILKCGQDGHHKRLQNLASEARRADRDKKPDANPRK